MTKYTYRCWAFSLADPTVWYSSWTIPQHCHLYSLDIDIGIRRMLVISCHLKHCQWYVIWFSVLCTIFARVVAVLTFDLIDSSLQCYICFILHLVIPVFFVFLMYYQCTWSFFASRVTFLFYGHFLYLYYVKLFVMLPLAVLLTNWSWNWLLILW